MIDVVPQYKEYYFTIYKTSSSLIPTDINKRGLCTQAHGQTYRKASHTHTHTTHTHTHTHTGDVYPLVFSLRAPDAQRADSKLQAADYWYFFISATDQVSEEFIWWSVWALTTCVFPWRRHVSHSGSLPPKRMRQQHSFISESNKTTAAPLTPPTPSFPSPASYRDLMC